MTNRFQGSDPSQQFPPWRALSSRAWPNQTRARVQVYTPSVFRATAVDWKERRPFAIQKKDEHRVPRDDPGSPSTRMFVQTTIFLDGGEDFL